MRAFASVGAGILIALAIIGCSSGRSSSNETSTVEPDDRWAAICSEPLAPIGQGQITADAFRIANAGIDDVVSAVERGDVREAGVTFFSQVHDFTHDVDAPLRAQNLDLAQRLCSFVGQMEEDFALDGNAASLAAQAAEVRDMLRQVASELGYD